MKVKDSRPEGAHERPAPAAAPGTAGIIALDDEGMIRAQQLLEETEFGGRKPHGLTRWLMGAVAVLWSLFQLWATYQGTISPIQLAAAHLGFAFALVFLAYPFGPRAPRDRVPWYDWLLTVLALVGPLYVILDFYGITQLRGGVASPTDVAFGTLMTAMLLLAGWRSLGAALPVMSLVMMLYAAIGPRGLIPITLPGALQLHAGNSWSAIVGQLYLTTEGIWGTPIIVSATFVFLFVLFGALLDRAGGGQFLTDLAYSVLGGFRGGPAKVAVVSSGLNGIVSGSSVSNVVTGGNITIGLMKRVGYPAEKAAAIEVAASSNGQIMPPVMGAAAFIMADLLQIPYGELIRMAALPAILAYLTLFMVVDLEAVKLGLRGVPRRELPPVWPVLRSGAHHLIPMAYLIYALTILQVTPERAALQAVGLTVLLMVVQEVVRAERSRAGVAAGLRRATLMVVESLQAGARNMIGIAVATAAAGIIVGMLTMTGLGFGLTAIVESLSGGNIILVLLLAMIASLVLGVGLPTTATYVVMATLIVPVILNLTAKAGMVVPPVAAHMFAFYFGIMADATPPVALAAFAASAIARSDPVKTGWQGFAYEMRTALLAFMFVFNPKLLLIGVSGPLEVASIALSALAGMWAFAAASLGWAFGPANPVQRLMLLGASLLLVTPGLVTDLAGVGLIVLTFLWQRVAPARAALAPRTPR